MLRGIRDVSSSNVVGVVRIRGTREKRDKKVSMLCR